MSEPERVTLRDGQCFGISNQTDMAADVCSQDGKLIFRISYWSDYEIEPETPIKRATFKRVHKGKAYDVVIIETAEG